MFVIGDGKEYNSKTEKYLNQPLRNNKRYVAFLRYFESGYYDQYYSTAWSKSVKASAKPPAPFYLNAKSIDKGKYKISWSISLRTGQTVKKYYAALVAATVGSKKEPVEISTNEKSVTVNVDYDTKYTFEIGLETETGKSGLGKITWFSHSEPMAPQKNNDSTYTVILKKPKVENIRTVSLVVLRLPPASAQSPAPEDVELKGHDEAAGENGAFVAKEYNISDFKSSNPIEIQLRKSSEKKKCRERDADEVYELKPDATYRLAQMNEDKSGKRFWSFWSAPMTFNKDEDGLKRKNSQKTNEDDTRVELLIPLVILSLCFLVSLGVIVYQRRLIQNNKRKDNEGHETTQMTDSGPETRKGAIKYDQEPGTPINDERVYETTDDVIEEIERNDGVRGTDKGEDSSDYMSLKENKEPANVYQALQPSTSDDVRYHIKEDLHQKIPPRPTFVSSRKLNSNC
ncbi:uncharacterized protein LOC114533244 [Dendronephthya gigantea]|uniref:uncharacterized protein LOC114533244 n=1 Tax=Dendronephthya gigantea TaxID=151771 RepID=UPI001069CA5D|nr:uncharacterized protein LOC114533244 [Dendronephthya gigantea]